MVAKIGAVKLIVVTTPYLAGHRIVEAVNGAEGLDLLGREKFDLAIIDLIMPEKEGIEPSYEQKSFSAEEKRARRRGRRPGWR